MTLVVADPRTLGTGALHGRRRVLVTDEGHGHGRSAVAAVRALAAGGYEPVVGASGSASLAAASRYARRRVKLPAPDAGDYRDAVVDWLRHADALGVLPTSDAALLALQAPVGHLVDKVALAHGAVAAGFLPLPQQRFGSLAELRAAAGILDYPVIVKPVVSRFPARCLRSAADLSAVDTATSELLVQPYLDEPLHAVAGIVWRGRLAATVHQRYVRTWPPEAGTSSAAVTVPLSLQLQDRLVALLDGYSGIFQAQLAGEHLLDLNPRVYGSLPLAVAAGVNLPVLLCELAVGAVLPPVRARPGVRYRWIEGDLRHLWWAWRGRRMAAAGVLRALRPRRGTAHSVASIVDPGPLLARVRYGLRKEAR